MISNCLKGSGYDVLLKEFKALINSKMQYNKYNDLITKIDYELKHLNFNFSHYGTKYLRETIIEVYKVKQRFDGNLKKNIYPIIAKRYKKNVNTIYCNIKKAILSMYLECNEDRLLNYFNYSYITKPKVNEIIFTILNKIDI